MANVPGVFEVFEKETLAESAVPSPVEVRHLWLHIIMEADRIEDLLANIRARLTRLKRWCHRGFVKQDDVEQADEWFEIKEQVIRHILEYRTEGAFLDDNLQDGAGI